MKSLEPYEQHAPGWHSGCVQPQCFTRHGLRCSSALLLTHAQQGLGGRLTPTAGRGMQVQAGCGCHAAASWWEACAAREWVAGGLGQDECGRLCIQAGGTQRRRQGLRLAQVARQQEVAFRGHRACTCQIYSFHGFFLWGTTLALRQAMGLLLCRSTGVCDINPNL